MLKELR